MALTLPGNRPIYAEDHAAFRDSVARFVAAEITPHLDDWRAEGVIPREVFAAAGAAGFLGAAVPEEFGGGGTEDMGFLAVLIEQTAAAGATSLALLWALQGGVAMEFLRVSDCTRWLPSLTAGELIATVATGAVTAADGRLSGELTGVCGARLADLLLVDLGDARVAVVEIDQLGVTVTPGATLLAGMDAGVADVTLDDAAVSTVLPYPMDRHLDLWFAVVALAAARAGMSLGVEYVSARKVFGRPLAEFENTRFRLAELSAGLATTTAFVDACVAAGADVRPDDAAAARLSAMGLLDDVVDQCLQFHGGYGYMREYPIATAFADARFLGLTAQQFSDPRTALAERLGL